MLTAKDLGGVLDMPTERSESYLFRVRFVRLGQELVGRTFVCTHIWWRIYEEILVRLGFYFDEQFDESSIRARWVPVDPLRILSCEAADEWHRVQEMWRRADGWRGAEYETWTSRLILGLLVQGLDLEEMLEGQQASNLP